MMEWFVNFFSGKKSLQLLRRIMMLPDVEQEKILLL